MRKPKLGYRKRLPTSNGVMPASWPSKTAQREIWYSQFLEIIQTRGFYVTGDVRRLVSKEEVPQKPDRPDAMRVVW